MSILHGFINPDDWSPSSSQETPRLQILQKGNNVVTLSGTPDTFAAIRLLIQDKKKILNSLLIIKDPGELTELRINKKLLNIAPPLGNLGIISKKEKEKIILNNKINFALNYLKSLIRVTHDYGSDNVVVQISKKAYKKVHLIPHSEIQKSIAKALKDKFVDN